MKGYIITMVIKDNYARMLFNYTLYGRASIVKRKFKTLGYYYPGILDNIKFYKIDANNIFVEKITEENIEMLKIFGKIKVEEYELSDTIALQTGKEFCMERIKNSGAIFRPKIKKW